MSGEREVQGHDISARDGGMVPHAQGDWVSHHVRVVEGLRAERDSARNRLRSAVDALKILRPFIRHADGCGHRRDRPCDCGLRISLEVLRETLPTDEEMKS